MNAAPERLVQSEQGHPMEPSSIHRRAFLGSLFGGLVAALTFSSTAEAVTAKLQIMQVKLKGGQQRTSGEAVAVQVKVKNIGGAAAGNMQLTVLLEGEKKKKDGSTDFGPPRAVGKAQKMPVPAPGQTITVELNFPAPALRPVDTGKQKVRIRFTGGPKEGSEQHAAFTVKPKEKPEKPEKPEKTPKTPKPAKPADPKAPPAREPPKKG
jgi:hypothetical protein